MHFELSITYFFVGHASSEARLDRGLFGSLLSTLAVLFNQQR
jgi:hypothetical protein